MPNLTTVTFYICQFQLKLTGGANFFQTAETYLYTWYKTQSSAIGRQIFDDTVPVLGRI